MPARPEPIAPLAGLPPYHVPHAPAAAIDLWLHGNEGPTPPPELLAAISPETVRRYPAPESLAAQLAAFAEQIARGGPVTVTHPEINRYFMSIPEAAQLVLQAGLMGHGGEVFVLDMGGPVKIVDLARNMIRLSGYGEDEIRIEFTGLRPGEKLYEELLAEAEETRETPHPKLRIARSRPLPEGFLDELTQWLSQPGPVSDDEVRAGLKRWVPEYAPARH